MTVYPSLDHDAFLISTGEITLAEASDSERYIYPTVYSFPIPNLEDSKCRSRSKISNNSSKSVVARTPNVTSYPKVVLIYVAARIQKSVSKLTAQKQTKFKVRCSRFVYTLAIDDSDKADKIRQSLPPCTFPPTFTEVFFDW